MFRWLKRVRRDDPVFGSMLYMGDKVRYWEGRAHFGPTGTPIEVLVSGASDQDIGPQHEFFAAVSKLWCDLLPVITTRIRRQYGHSSEEVLQLSGLSIPESPFSDVAEWEASFLTQGESHYTVHMKGRNPEWVAWDT